MASALPHASPIFRDQPEIPEPDAAAPAVPDFT